MEDESGSSWEKIIVIIFIIVAFIVLLALLNVASLRHAPHHTHARLVGLRGHWLGARVRGGPLAAVGIGAMFALSFDTLSLATLVAVSAAQQGGWPGALQCALVFTAGMLATDGLNGLWITRLLRRSDQRAVVASRAMGWAVVGVSLFSAGLGLAGQFSPSAADMPELLPGMVVVGALGLALAFGRLRGAQTRTDSRA